MKKNYLHPECGAGNALMIGFLALMLACVMGVLAGYEWLGVRAKTRSIADVTALYIADGYVNRGNSVAEACHAGEKSVSRQGANLLSCTTMGEKVTISVQLPGTRFFPAVTAQATAGPV